MDLWVALWAILEHCHHPMPSTTPPKSKMACGTTIRGIRRVGCQKCSALCATWASNGKRTPITPAPKPHTSEPAPSVSGPCHPFAGLFPFVMTALPCLGARQARTSQKVLYESDDVRAQHTPSVNVGGADALLRLQPIREQPTDDMGRDRSDSGHSESGKRQLSPIQPAAVAISRTAASVWLLPVPALPSTARIASGVSKMWRATRC